MRHIEFYLEQLFGYPVYDIELNYKSPRAFVGFQRMLEYKYECLPGELGLINIELNFKAFVFGLPDKIGSLVLIEKSGRALGYDGLVQYKYKCLRGKETTELFRYALGADE